MSHRKAILCSLLLRCSRLLIDLFNSVTTQPRELQQETPQQLITVRRQGKHMKVQKTACCGSEEHKVSSTFDSATVVTNEDKCEHKIGLHAMHLLML